MLLLPTYDDEEILASCLYDRLKRVGNWNNGKGHSLLLNYC